MPTRPLAHLTVGALVIGALACAPPPEATPPVAETAALPPEPVVT